MTYPMTVAGLRRDLPICKVTDDLYIGAFIVFGDAELTVACARELLKLVPAEDYDYEAMKGDHFFAGAYLGERCVGLAIYERPWNRWLYLSDLKVCRDARRMGAARRLLEEGMAIAREEGYQGVSTICQDNNLNAALFYLNSGFAIGGLDTRVYDGTKQAGKSDIFLYRAL